MRTLKRPVLHNNLITLALLVQVVIPGATSQARAQTKKTPYAKMAPLDQYLMRDEKSEIALARSAAPASLFHTVGDLSGEATTLNNIGLVYADRGERQKALDYYGLWRGVKISAPVVDPKFCPWMNSRTVTAFVSRMHSITTFPAASLTAIEMLA